MKLCGVGLHRIEWFGTCIPECPDALAAGSGHRMGKCARCGIWDKGTRLCERCQSMERNFRTLSRLGRVT